MVRKTGNQGGCNFVASKSGKKFHTPGCRYANKIREDKKECFATRDQAMAAGYTPGSFCKP
jgi:micrococcal nuclease